MNKTELVEAVAEKAGKALKDKVNTKPSKKCKK